MASLIHSLITFAAAAGLLLHAPRLAVAAPCRGGLPLLAHINNSDAVAVVRKTHRVERLRGSTRIFFEFVDLLKPPLNRTYDRTIPQIMYPQDMDTYLLRGSREYLAFLRYESANTWSTGRCGLLALTPSKEVLDACTAISDLFGDKPYERERLCLLRYPPSAELRLVRNEILDNVRDGAQFSGSGTLAADFRYDPATSYQKVIFELDTRQRMKFFGTKLAKQSFPLVAYIKTSKVESRKELERLLRRGRKFKFSGAWNQGSFELTDVQ